MLQAGYGFSWIQVDVVLGTVSPLYVWVSQLLGVLGLTNLWDSPV